MQNQFVNPFIFTAGDPDTPGNPAIPDPVPLEAPPITEPIPSQAPPVKG